MPNKKLKLIKDDPWLEPSEAELINRFQRYERKLTEIEENFDSLKKFANGYKYFGFNYSKNDRGLFYREWAPQAYSLYLTGDFNNWSKDTHPLVKDNFGIWEIFLSENDYPHAELHQSKIKVIVNSKMGSHFRIPAYIQRAVQDEDTKNFTGQVWLPDQFDWSGDKFSQKKDTDLFIYECHVGMAQEKEGVGSYAEFRKNILPRIKNAGYNAIQLMAIQEHPYYGSFGYHVSSFFAPSSRFGTPEELKELIKEAHKLGIAVILDIVHSHTVKNTVEGINQFDGSDSQYFHAGARGDHPQWDSKLFDYGKTEVLRFLLSNLKYWLQEFKFDGFRFDGVGSMMYFHHGIESIDSREKYFNQGVEWDAITYLQLANKLVHSLNPNAITIAEDVTGMPGLTAPIKDGGLGFDYRLGMGIPDFWIKLLKEYKDEDWNIHEIWNVLNDRLPHVKTIAYAESHDQALVGDKTLAFWLMDKEMYWHMQKDDPHLLIERGIALHKMLRLFTITVGGHAYMNFMGNEFGHPEWIDFPREGNNWSYKHCRRQWSLVDNTDLKYQFLDAFDKKMVKMVKENKIMSSMFAQQLNMDEWNKTIIFERNNLLFLFNFHTSHSIPDYEFRVPLSGEYEIILTSDSKEFGGHGRIDLSVTFPAYQKENDPSFYLKIYNTNRTALVLKRKS
ncbi:MAG: alpha amylase C-terminal domain-containing protein [Bacteroidales bacterium]|nr:alpha amylase C-terminal domain-containing protein [Bacteroidales bacterium]MCF8403816.1 alpha amylase C-terminal domain-containing protein [Bacteroidales bacterium]